jgi:catechol 2,3-dioxygenase-like lactoylglutathione lyase family enzyme
MKKQIRVVVIGLVLFLALAFCKGELMAEEQKNKTGFVISFHHVAISVADLDKSIAWYRDMLGFEEVVRMDQGVTEDKMSIGHIRRGNCYIELFQVAGSKPLPEYRRDPNADFKVQGLKHFALQVNDAKAAIKELTAKGVEIAFGPVDTPEICFVFIRDNSGNAFELIEYKKK